MPYPAPPPDERPFAGVLLKNIAALVEMRRASERARTRQERVADAITRFTGSMTFVYLHLGIFGLWVAVNLRAIPGVRPFDPSFVVLAMVASVEAIFLSTFVLISQNRMSEAADRRAELDLQISLLAEHEVTQLLTLTDAIAHHLGVPRGDDTQLEESKQDVDPTSVMEMIDRREDEVRGGD